MLESYTNAVIGKNKHYNVKEEPKVIAMRDQTLYGAAASIVSQEEAGSTHQILSEILEPKPAVDPKAAKLNDTKNTTKLNA